MLKKEKSPYSRFIRNLYSDSMSALMISFYRYNLSFRLDPFVSKDGTGKSTYNYNNGITTTVNYEGAAGLYITAKNIIDGKQEADGVVYTIPSASGATLILERRPFSTNGQAERMETFLVITKDNKSIAFKFNTWPYKVKENGQLVTKIRDTGLGAFTSAIEGYLTGIGADLHLSKLPEDFNDIEDAVQQAPYTLGNSGCQISYGNYQNTPSNGQ